jgi:hypothetical protein
MNSQAVAFIIFSLLFSGSVDAQAPIVGELLSVARSAVPRELSDSELRSVLQRGLRHPAGNAVAVVIPRPEASLVLIFIRQPDGIFLATDASGVESGNFGKLGRPRTDYERYETEPIEWRQRDDDLLQVVIRTRAWRMGQRYTVAEPLIIKPDGAVLYR